MQGGILPTKQWGLMAGAASWHNANVSKVSVEKKTSIGWNRPVDSGNFFYDQINVSIHIYLTSKYPPLSLSHTHTHPESRFNQHLHSQEKMDSKSSIHMPASLILLDLHQVYIYIYILFIFYFLT